MFNSGVAQVNDAGLWLDVTLEKQVTQRIDFILTEELRFNENVTELGSFYTEAGFEYKYKFLKGLKTGLFYRFANKRRLDDSYSKIHRAYGDIAYRYEFTKKLDGSIRLRLQSQFKDFSSSETGKIPITYLRGKLGFRYAINKRFRPYLEGELWYALYANERQFDNLRTSAGTYIRINRIHGLDIGFIYQKEFNVNNPVTDIIGYLGYKISF